MVEAKDSCVQAAKGPIGMPQTKTSQDTEIQKEGLNMMAQVGKPAPDFEASAPIGTHLQVGGQNSG